MNKPKSLLSTRVTGGGPGKGGPWKRGHLKKPIRIFRNSHEKQRRRVPTKKFLTAKSLKRELEQFGIASLAPTPLKNHLVSQVEPIESTTRFVNER